MYVIASKKLWITLGLGQEVRHTKVLSSEMMKNKIYRKIYC